MKNGTNRSALFATLLLCLALVIGCATTTDADSNVRVTADRHDLASAPVAVKWDGRDLAEDARVFLRGDDGRRPAQVEHTDAGETYLWFFADVPAGESRDYEVVFDAPQADHSFRWEQQENNTAELLANDTAVLRYVHPDFDPEDVENTMKPFHHVYAPDGSRLITKGPGGLYSHHRGIYFGYNRIRVNGESLDVWHSRNGEHTEHLEVKKARTGPVFGDHVVIISWNKPDGEPFAEETRHVRAFRQPDGDTVIDVHSTLRSVAGAVELGGDLHHGGLQFRAAQYVADNAEHSRFLRPEPWDEHPADEELEDTENYVDLPWNAFQFRVEGNDYTAGYFSHPDNPDGAQMSERLYGRFGEFIPYEIDDDRSLTLSYRFWFADTHDVARGRLEAIYSTYAEHGSR